MNTINQTDKELKRIEAKITLGLPLTARENALAILYGKATAEVSNGKHGN